MKTIIKTLLIGLTLSFSSIVWTQNINTLSPEVQNRIDSTINKLMAKYKVVGSSIAIVDGGKVVYATGYGFQDRENNIKADANTIYRIGSCTKSFTAMSLMQLQEQNKLNVNNSIQEYVPSIQIGSRFSDDNPILIKDLLTHTSGLPSDILNGFFCDTPPDADWLIKQINKSTMSAPANYQHSYSNTGYGLLGKLITETSGQGYEDYLKTNIFDPIGMNSSFVYDTMPHVKHISKGYLNTKLFNETQIRDAAAGLIHSNVIDMAKYIQVYLNKPENSVLSPASIREMEKNSVGNLALKTSSDWGYGLYASKISIHKDNDTIESRFIGHGGDTWAFHADFKYIPELGVGAVVLTNSNQGNRIASAERLIKIYLDESDSTTIHYEKNKAGNEVKSETLPSKKDIIGRYSVSGIDMAVSNPEKIKFKAGSTAKVILKPIDDSLRYDARVRLFGFIPVKVKHQQFRFVNYQDATYLKVIYMPSEREDFASVKTETTPISDSWYAAFGNYKLVGDFYACEECPYLNFEGLTLKLYNNNGIIKGEFKGKTKDTNRTLSFNEISNTLAISTGIGRNTGEALRILENGNLFYSGFEFEKIP